MDPDMIDIKRYSFEWNRSGVLEVQEHPHGDYVRYDDFIDVVSTFSEYMRASELYKDLMNSEE